MSREGSFLALTCVMMAYRCSARLPGRQSLRVYAEGDKEADLGTEAKPQEAGGNFYNDERPVSLFEVPVLLNVGGQARATLYKQIWNSLARRGCS